MSIIGKLFGKDDVIKKASEGIYNGVDAAWFTSEEKAEHFKSLLKLYEPFKIAQRLLACIVCIPYVFIWLCCACLYIASAFFDPCVDGCKYAQLAHIAQDLATFNHQNLSMQAGIILAFYFGGGAVEGIVRAKSSP